MNVPRRNLLPRLSLLAVALATAAGCGGYQSGYKWDSLYPQSVETVAVPIFANLSFHRGVEFPLTQAVVQQIEQGTPYKVVSREEADTILEGEIVSVKVNTLSLDDETALPQEQMLTVTVNFLWKDLRSGRVLVRRREFEQAVAYYPTLGESRFYGSREAAERLAVAIVQELQREW